MDRINKNIKAVLINQIIIISLLLIVIVGFSYAYFSNGTNISNTTLPTAYASVSCLKIEVSNDNELYFNSSTPVNDEDVINDVTPTTYTITNLCSSSTKYNFALTTFSNNDSNHLTDDEMKIYVTKKIDNGQDEPFIGMKNISNIDSINQGISMDYINNKIDNDSTLNAYDNAIDYIIDSITIEASQVITYKVYNWIDSEATNTSGKYFYSALSLIENGEYYSIGGFSEAYKLFDGTEYINTNVQLFTEENYMKNFELGFTIDEFDVSRYRSGQGDTVFSGLYEASPYPGILFRMQDKKWLFQAGSGIGTNKKINFAQGSVETFRVRRIDGKIYYSVNGEAFQFAADLSTLSRYFDTPVTFGVGLDLSNVPIASKYLVGGIKDMYVKYLEGDIEVDYSAIDNQIEEFVGVPLTVAYNSQEAHVFDGTDANVINTNLELFNSTNYQKSFVVTLNLDEYDNDSQIYQATLFDAKDEHNETNDYPGIVLRKTNSYIQLTFKDGEGINGLVNIPATAKRINIIKKGMEFYYQYDESTIRALSSTNSFANFDPNNCFSSPALFGGILKASGSGYDRKIIGTLSNMSIKISN